MMRNLNRLLAGGSVLLLALFAASASMAVAQDDDSDANAAAALAARQSRVADKYRQLEELLFKMEQLERGANPQRAKLLREAVTHGREEGIALQLNALIRRLSQEEYKLAIDGQTQVRADLQALLELLQKEDRARRNASEQARIKEYIRELDRLIRKERSIQGRTEGGADAEGLAKEQGDLADRTGDLANKIRENEEPAAGREGEDGAPSADAQPQEDGQPQDGQPQDGQPQDGQPQDGQSQDGQPQDGQPQDGQPQDGQPQDGQPQDGQGGESGEQQEQNPARQRVEQARQKMRQAQEELERAQRENAVKEQEEARRLLEQAKAELEEILRQLREEEIERTLAMLEARFRKMLKMQEIVRDETVRLDSAQKAGEDPTLPARAAKASFEQKKIVVEADRALALLKEEGSSAAFPEVVGQMRGDMQQVVDRLAEVQVGTITQGIQEDIIDTLNELIEALQQAQKDQKQRQHEGQPQDGQGEDPGLVDMIAELKMIRAMQQRVNGRTRRYADLLDNPEDVVGQATAGELQEAIVRLGERELNCHRITRDIVLGKNR